MHTREGAFLASEELAFDEVLRQGRAVHRDERSILAGAQLMNGIGYHPLAGAGFAKIKHGGIGGGNLFGRRDHSFEGLAFPHDFLESPFRLELFAKVEVLVFEPAPQFFDFLRLLIELILHVLALADVDRHAHQAIRLTA